MFTFEQKNHHITIFSPSEIHFLLLKCESGNKTWYETTKQCRLFLNKSRWPGQIKYSYLFIFRNMKGTINFFFLNILKNIFLGHLFQIFMSKWHILDDLYFLTVNTWKFVAMFCPNMKLQRQFPCKYFIEKKGKNNNLGPYTFFKINNWCRFQLTRCTVK